MSAAKRRTEPHAPDRVVRSESDVWLELIENTARSMRQLLLVIVVLSAVSAIGVTILAAIFLYLLLRTPPAIL